MDEEKIPSFCNLALVVKFWVNTTSISLKMTCITVSQMVLTIYLPLHPSQESFIPKLQLIVKAIKALLMGPLLLELGPMKKVETVLKDPLSTPKLQL